MFDETRIRLDAANKDRIVKWSAKLRVTDEDVRLAAMASHVLLPTRHPTSVADAPRHGLCASS